MGVLVFVVTASCVLSDSRVSLVSDAIRPYHPSMLYAYLALILQGGVVQVRTVRDHLRDSIMLCTVRGMMTI